tara:strand:- start:582 stop:962 length:381 start_codon:yes stop_codon:yes gene_type:complete
MTYTFADELISDLHKDAHGFRPSASFMDAWRFDSDEGKQATWDYLVEVMKESQAQDIAAEEKALLLFKDKLRSVMGDLGYTWKQALRSLSREAKMADDLPYFLWCQGLSYYKNNEIMGCYNERADV